MKKIRAYCVITFYYFHSKCLNGECIKNALCTNFPFCKDDSYITICKYDPIIRSDFNKDFVVFNNEYEYGKLAIVNFDNLRNGASRKIGDFNLETSNHALKNILFKFDSNSMFRSEIPCKKNISKF